MKRIMRHAVILFLALFALVFPAMAGEHQNYGYQQLNDTQKAVYDKIVEAIAEHEDTVNLRKIADLSEAEFLLVHDMVLSDHPELFWYDGYISYSMSGSGNVTSATFLYAMEEAQLEEAQAAFNEQVEKVLSSIPEEAESDYDKALYLFDLLVETITYEQVGYHQTAYGALVDRTAVCAGYARAYQHLLHKIGIDSFYVYGELISLQTGQNLGPHAWNLVWLDGKCLYTDVTAGDPDTGDVWHGYFNVAYDKIATSHIAAEEVAAILPKCEGHDELDYYSVKSAKGSGVLKRLSMETTVQEFVEHAYQERGDTYACAIVSAYCEDYAVFNEWWQNNGDAVWEALGYPSLRLKIDASDNEVRVTITSGEVPEKNCDHRFVTIEKPASCTEGASIQYSCLLCDYYREENGEAALGHEWSEWESIDETQHVRKCTRGSCNAEETGEHAFAHVAEEGVLWKRCSVCSYGEAGTDVKLEDKTVTVSLGDWPDDAKVMIASFSKESKLQEVYAATIEREATTFSFQKDLNGCTMKVFFLMDNYEPWLMEIVKSF